MAYHLCCSPLHRSNDHNLFCKLLSFPESLKSTAFRPAMTPEQLSYPLSLHPATPLQIARVSVQKPISEGTQKPNSSVTPNQMYPDDNTTSSSKGNKRVDPRRSKASKRRRKWYSSLGKIAKSLNSCDPTEKKVYDILAGLGDKIVAQDAVIVLNIISKPETALIALKYFQQNIKFTKEVILYNVTMKLFRKCKNLDGAEKLFDEMLNRGVQPDRVTFSTMISCARLSNLPHKAVEWYEKMPSYGCKLDNANHLAMIDSYGRCGKIGMALNLFDRAKAEKWGIDALTFSTLIKIYGRCGNFNGCLNVPKEMKALCIMPNLEVYNTLLDAMGRAKRPWHAKSIYQEMLDNGLKANWRTYAALIRAFGRARYGKDGVKMYRKMKRKGMRLNVTLYNTLLALCADVGSVDDAIEIFEDMKLSENCKPDSRTFSSLITVYACNGKVSEAESMLNKMVEAGFEPTIFVLTSLIHCYGKTNRTDDVIRTFNQLLELGITPDDRFCGSLLSVMTQTPKEELGKLVSCIEKANSKLGYVVKLLVDAGKTEGEIFKREAQELFNVLAADVKKAYCNCLIDLCLNLDMVERACELLDLGLTLRIYRDVESKSQTQWSIHLKSLSAGAALTVLHVWVNDLSKALENGEELPPLLGINTGHGKHKYSDKGLVPVFESHLKDLNAPFHENPDQIGWFLTTKLAAKAWLESKRSQELIAS